MLSSLQHNQASTEDEMLPSLESMSQWDFTHLPLVEQLKALGDEANPPSFSVVHFLREWARKTSDRPCLLVPNTTATAYVTFSYAQYDAATNHIARDWAFKLNHLAWLSADRTRPGMDEAPIALLVKDLPTSHFLIIAFHKLRIPVLLLSTRNSPAAVSHLVTNGNVSAILIEDGLQSLLEQQMSHVPTYSVSPIHPDELLKVSDAPPIPHCAKVDADDIAVIVHTSGSTGLPKLIPTTYRSMYFSCIFFDISDKYFARRTRGSVLMILPVFHALGVRVMMNTFLTGRALVLPLMATWPVSAAQAAASLAQSESRILVTVPTILEQLASNKNTYAALAKLNMALYGGACLSVETAKLFHEQMGIQLISLYGSSEGGLLMVGSTDANVSDASNRFDALVMGPLTHAYMEQVDEGLYELVVHRDSLMGGIMPTDELGLYYTGDLFQKCGNESYIVTGRKDDTLVHTNGENSSALPMENSLVGTEPVILRALVVGSKRSCTAALIELDPEIALLLSPEEIAARIAHACAQVNIAAPKHSRLLYPDMVTVLPLGGPSLVTTEKGNVRRRQCNEIFEREIDLLYSGIGESLISPSETCMVPTSTVKYSVMEIEKKLRKLLIELLSQGSADLLRTDDNWRQLDFFSNLGVDSLQATHARGRIAKQFGFRLSADSIFSYSTIEQIAKMMVLHQNDAEAMEESTQADIEESMAELQNNRTLEYIRKLTNFSDLTVHSGENIMSHENEARILLTGATGSLGAWVLDSLLQRPLDNVKTVFLLVRGSAEKAVDRVRESLRQRHCNVARFDAAVSTKRFVVLGNYDTKDSKFGLATDMYKRLEQEVTVLLHVAWSVGFNKPVQAYEDQIGNVAQFARFATVPAIHSSAQPKRVVFTSSISVAFGYPVTSAGDCAVPEEVLEIGAATAVAGYSRSKFASEIILMEVYRQCGVPVKIVRVGQIAGDREHGVWSNATEMNALLTCAPTTVHAVPSSGVTQVVDWIPVDDVANALLEFALDTSRSTCVYNLVNPKTISWSEFIEILRRALPATQFEVLPYSQWVERLSKDLESGEKDEDIKQRNPFFELIPFLQQSVPREDGKPMQEKALEMVTHAAQRDSSVIRNLPAIDDALVCRYLRSWQHAGLIDPHVVISEF
ncbi:hypothetical protein BG004_006392 [Podila humilis]|nr:hypothetical protein BG004_006392 [Podila humilis]